MDLFFVRHGPAEPKVNWSGDDLERPLSAEGRLIVEEVAARLAQYRMRPERVVTSPYVRARQTARILAERLGLADRVVVDARLIPGFGLRQLGKLLSEHTDSQGLMLVGHGPDVTQVVRALTGGRLTIRKAGVAQVEVPDPEVLKGRLLSLLVPTPLPQEDALAGDSDS